IHGAERIAGRIGLWMEFVRGCTLEETLQKGKRFTAKEVTGLGLELCRAVSAVHAAGLVHRDIKAQNVMVAADGRLVLMDFGAGRELDDSVAAPLAGTPLYLAPEVLAGGAATARSEVYSIGVVMHHLLTGSFPVQGANLDELRRAHDARVTTDIRSARPDVPQRLARIIERACDPEPNRRYASADTFAAALAALEGLPASVRRAYAAAAAVALVAVVVVAWQFAIPKLQSSGATAVGAAGTVATSSRIPIAVLPFSNLAAEPGSDDFVDGLTREVIRSLSGVEALQLISQSSSFAFKGKPRDLEHIARTLGVDLIVEADVLRAGPGLRVHVQLVRVADRTQVWAQQFNRPVGDVFEVRDAISHGIAGALGVAPGRRQRSYQVDSKASELYVRARGLVNRRGLENAQRASALFEEIIANNPTFAPAHAGAVDAYAEMSWQMQTGDGPPALEYEEALRRMRPAARRALELDPELPEAHAAMGAIYAREQEWIQARQSFERAIRLDSSLTHIQTSYALSVLFPLGQAAEALRILEARLDVDSMSLDLRRALAIGQIIVGDYDQAIEHLRRVLNVDPDYPHASLLLARALTFAGRLEEAHGIWNTRKGPAGRIWAAHTYVKSGRREEAEQLLDTNDLPHRQAVVYAALGDKARTLEALNRAADTVPQRTVMMLAYPEMALLRGDPGLAVLRKRFKLQ
ncbi:MAG TPA: protein kinase, partial [Vicinamibacterales bacterium]|nr:protein kinase [Vicinamibacterales bacterium]